MNTILVIDDNEDFRADLREILEFENYATLEAENGQLGLQMIRQHSPDLIVCDVEMPVMNGIDVLRTAKADPAVAKIPFLIITGRSDEQTLKTSQDLAVEAYLTKPINVTEFLSTIVSFLSAEAPALRST
jgi:CheY-like chemotaxis protein